MFMKLYRALKLLQQYPDNPANIMRAPIRSCLKFDGRKLYMEFYTHVGKNRVELHKAPLDEILAMNKSKGFERKTIDGLGWRNRELDLFLFEKFIETTGQQMLETNTQ